MRKTRNGGETFLIFNTTKRFTRLTKSRPDEILLERLRRIIPTNGNVQHLHIIDGILSERIPSHRIYFGSDSSVQFRTLINKLF